MHKHRPYFNWTHFIIGTVAYVLSIPTMMLGLRLPSAGVQLRTLNYPLWILIFFVIFQFCTEIILEIHGCLHYRRNKGGLRRFYASRRIQLQPSYPLVVLEDCVVTPVPAIESRPTFGCTA